MHVQLGPRSREPGARPCSRSTDDVCNDRPWRTNTHARSYVDLMGGWSRLCTVRAARAVMSTPQPEVVVEAQLSRTDTLASSISSAAPGAALTLESFTLSLVEVRAAPYPVRVNACIQAAPIPNIPGRVCMVPSSFRSRMFESDRQEVRAYMTSTWCIPAIHTSVIGISRADGWLAGDATETTRTRERGSGSEIRQSVTWVRPAVLSLLISLPPSPHFRTGSTEGRGVRCSSAEPSCPLHHHTPLLVYTSGPAVPSCPLMLVEI
jgi:hypothetical protein